MTCISCRKGFLEPNLSAGIPAEIKGVKVTVKMSGLVCSRCGFTTVPGASMPEYMRLAADEYRKKNGLLTSTEIRARRKTLQMTQEEFAEYIGVGRASIKRWELGQVQEQAMDKLMRMLTGVEAARSNYKMVAQKLGKQAVQTSPAVRR